MRCLARSAPARAWCMVGDVGRTDDLLEICRDADALVIEATYLDEEAEMAREFAHLTARQGAELAVKAGVKNLLLTHISRRYRERDVIAEARSVFPNAVVARDFDDYQIKRGELSKVELSEDEESVGQEGSYTNAHKRQNKLNETRDKHRVRSEQAC